MVQTPERVRQKTLTIKPAQPKEPKGLRIALFVCDCYADEKPVLNSRKAESIANCLSISLKQLEEFVICAIKTKDVVTIASYKQHEVARAKLAQIKIHTPFISGSCHHFYLVIDK